jgi:hypothetical protein
MLSEYSLQHVFFASNWIFVWESVRIFWSKYEANYANKLERRFKIWKPTLYNWKEATFS